MTPYDAVSDRATWIKGPPAVCSLPPKEVLRPWRLVLLGAPGTGKGTQAELLGQALGTCRLTTGDIFRYAAKADPSALSGPLADAVSHMRKGELVPDSTLIPLLQQRAKCLKCKGGFILDGFPRTLPQAESLARILEKLGTPLHAVIDFRLPTEEVVARLAGRRSCSKCSAPYHLTTNPPKVDGKCDACGSPLVQREDDYPAVIQTRLEAYHTLTAPLAKYYESQRLLIPIDAHGTPQDITRRTLTALKKHSPYDQLTA